MALKYIDNDVMLQISGTWLDSSSDAHKAIVVNPDLASLLPRLGSSHTGLAALLQPGSSARLSAIITEEANLDIRHDGIIRGVYSFLTGAAELSGGDAGQALLELRDVLAPEGLQSTQKSYRAEATQASQLKDRISHEIKIKLDSIQVGPSGESRPLRHYVDEWLSLGKKLGDLEDEKGRLQDAPADTVAMATLKARNLWIRTVNAFLANADLAELDEATDRLVFGPLRAAEKAAVRKVKKGPTTEGASTQAPAAGATSNEGASAAKGP